MNISKLDRNLALEAVRVTEATALSSSLLMGRGDEKAADQSAVNAMRYNLNNLLIEGTVVIGEGERDNAPMLYIGEKVGKGKGLSIDIAADPAKAEAPFPPPSGFVNLKLVVLSNQFSDD